MRWHPGGLWAAASVPHVLQSLSLSCSWSPSSMLFQSNITCQQILLKFELQPGNQEQQVKNTLQWRFAKDWTSGPVQRQHIWGHFLCDQSRPHRICLQALGAASHMLLRSVLTKRTSVMQLEAWQERQQVTLPRGQAATKGEQSLGSLPV